MTTNKPDATEKREFAASFESVKPAMMARRNTHSLPAADSLVTDCSFATL